ncbi:hypothetical protein ACS0PU_006715 [Formica fusca]
METWQLAWVRYVGESCVSTSAPKRKLRPSQNYTGRMAETKCNFLRSDTTRLKHPIRPLYIIRINCRIVEKLIALPKANMRTQLRHTKTTTTTSTTTTTRRMACTYVYSPRGRY